MVSTSLFLLKERGWIKVNNMHWNTKISNITKKGEEVVRGYKLTELIGRLTFSEAMWLVLRGELPNKKEQRMFDAILVAIIEHGIGTASAMSSRIVASTGSAMNSALAGGLLAAGPVHGGAIGDAAKMLQEAGAKNENAAQLVERYLATKKRIPGFGHRVLTKDERAEKLMALAKRLGLAAKHVKLMTSIGSELQKSKGKGLPLNVDGAIAAIVSDLGFDAVTASGIFAIGRLPGLLAHASEEVLHEKTLRRLELDESSYNGPKSRRLKRRS